ncbi:MAG: hypothetical protein AAGU32_14395 [Bacillota bacterium]
MDKHCPLINEKCLGVSCAWFRQPSGQSSDTGGCFVVYLAQNSRYFKDMVPPKISPAPGN